MWAFDLDSLEILAVNDAATERYGYTREEFLAMKVTALRPPEEVPRLLAYLREPGRDLHLQRYWRHRTKDGTVIDVAITSSEMLWGGRRVEVVAVEDVSERQRVEERLRLQAVALEAAANAIVITDRAGRIEWVNAEFERLTGHTRHEAIGATPRVLRSGVHDADFYATLWRTILAGDVWRGVIVNRRKDGTLYDEEMTITPVPDGAGTVTHFIAIKQDVSERRRMEETLRRNEEHFRALIENALDMILVVDGDGVIRYVSPSVERTLGYPPAELIGTSAFALVHPDDVDRARSALERGRAVAGATMSVDCRVRHRDGGWRFTESRARNLLDDAAVGGIIVNSRDITERRRAEEAEQRLQEQLALSEKLAAMGELVAGVAHELNNPLLIVTGNTMMLRRTARDPAVLARAEKIGDAAERCARIVKNFLALSRRHAPERKPVDLNRLVRESVELLAYPLRVDGVRVAMRLADDLPAVDGDPHQLQQVLVNLVTNAHHAMRENGPPRILTLETAFDPAGERVTVAVADTGPGIPADVEPRIFEPFFTTKPPGLGTGLGLSISLGIVQAHGGAIRVDAMPLHAGARFVIELPLPARGAAATGAESDPGPVPPCSILVVDDEHDVAAVIAEIAGAAGHRVECASSAADALARLDGQRYDLVLSDVKMPDTDGIALYHALAARHPELLARFAFVTGDVVSPATARFIELRSLPMLRKPFGEDDLARLLQRIVRPDHSGRG